jgi:hypothetical protein
LGITLDLTGHKEREISADLAALLCGHRGLFGQHHWDIVANGIDAPARLALQSLAIRRQLHGSFALWADKNV